MAVILTSSNLSVAHDKEISFPAVCSWPWHYGKMTFLHIFDNLDGMPEQANWRMGLCIHMLLNQLAQCIWAFSLLVLNDTFECKARGVCMSIWWCWRRGPTQKSAPGPMANLLCPWYWYLHPAWSIVWSIHCSRYISWGGGSVYISLRKLLHETNI